MLKKLMHLSYIKFYQRLINKPFIIVKDAHDIFQNNSNFIENFGLVEKRPIWETGRPKDTVDFLDLTITITKDGTIYERIFRTENNPQLYGTPSSVQTASIIKASIYGTM